MPSDFENAANRAIDEEVARAQERVEREVERLQDRARRRLEEGIKKILRDELDKRGDIGSSILSDILRGALGGRRQSDIFGLSQTQVASEFFRFIQRAGRNL